MKLQHKTKLIEPIGLWPVLHWKRKGVSHVGLRQVLIIACPAEYVHKLAEFCTDACRACNVPVCVDLFCSGTSHGRDIAVVTALTTRHMIIMIHVMMNQIQNETRVI